MKISGVPGCNFDFVTFAIQYMEDWQYEYEWLRVRHLVKDAMERETLPDMNAMLFLIGMQEVGKVQASYTKEEKQDLMHVGICHLLSQYGYYDFLGLDEDGWPHFKQVQPLSEKGESAQEKLLIRSIIDYFKDINESL